MKLFLLSQTKNRGYDTYDAVVVAAPDEATARTIYPCGCGWDNWDRSWADTPEEVTVKYLGEAVGINQGIVLASFNAG